MVSARCLRLLFYRRLRLSRAVVTKVGQRWLRLVKLINSAGGHETRPTARHSDNDLSEIIEIAI